MRIQTRGNSNTVWLSSDEGVINGTMTLSVTPLEKILQAVNEKYGTSFESWSLLPTAYEVGDTVPNWNAYEKIFKQTLIAVKISEGSVYAHYGYIEKNKFYWAGKNNGTQMQQLNITTGYITGVSNFNQAVENSIYQTIRQRYQNVSEIGPYDSELNNYQQPQNWSEYEIMG